MRKNWNKILPAIVACVVIVVLIVKHNELDTFVQTIRNVQFLPFALAVAGLFGRYGTHAYAYQAIFRCIGEKVTYGAALPLAFSVTFANDAAPTAGMAGSVVIAVWSHKQGLDMGKSVSVVFVEKVGFYGGFAVVMLIGFAILAITGQLTPLLAAGGLIVVFMIVGFGSIFTLAYKSPDKELRLFRWAERWANKFLLRFHHDPMNPWADRIAASFHEAARLAFTRPRVLLIMFARMVLLHACDCFCFNCVGFAFGFTNIPLLIGSYVAGFVIATFIPQTIGAVEILLAIILTSYGADEAAAAAIALVYRGLIFWVPFLIGAICINITGGKGQFDSEENKAILEQSEAEHAAQAAQTFKEDMTNVKGPAKAVLGSQNVSEKIPVSKADNQSSERASKESI